MSEFFKTYTVDEIIELSKKPIEYDALNDMQSLHHLRGEINRFLYQNKNISDSVRDTLDLLVVLLNNEMEKTRGLR